MVEALNSTIKKLKETEKKLIELKMRLEVDILLSGIGGDER
jgi:hypothetical protein